MNNLVGRGRFSNVYKQGTQAVKVVDIDDLIAPHSYKAEIKALEILKHPNIVRLVEHEFKGKIEPELHLVFPYYPQTLENVLYAHSKASWPPGSGWRNVLEIPQAAHIGRQLASALAYIHSHGIIHRDIKPENVLFAADSLSPVLIDFGIAWVPHVGEDPKVCDVASAEYKAPELLLGNTDYTTAIDVWALGCVLALLVSPDCTPLFGEYHGDIALLATQLCVLGPPPPGMTINMSATEDLSGRLAALRGLAPAVGAALQWEFAVRPSAAELEQLLGELG